MGSFGRSNSASLFGRLLSSASGEEHRRAFLDWLQLNLERQLADLEEFLSSLPEEQRLLLEGRLADGSYTDIVPGDAPTPERMLFLTDIDTVLQIRKIC